MQRIQSCRQVVQIFAQGSVHEHVTGARLLNEPREQRAPLVVLREHRDAELGDRSRARHLVCIVVCDDGGNTLLEAAYAECLGVEFAGRTLHQFVQSCRWHAGACRQGKLKIGKILETQSLLAQGKFDTVPLAIDREKRTNPGQGPEGSIF